MRLLLVHVATLLSTLIKRAPRSGWLAVACDPGSE